MVGVVFRISNEMASGRKGTFPLGSWQYILCFFFFFFKYILSPVKETSCCIIPRTVAKRKHKILKIQSGF